MPKYRCLVLDHDDTVVKSTREIHYPSFLDTLSQLRPGTELSFRQFAEYSFDPGFLKMCYDIYGFTDEELSKELEIWNRHVRQTIPSAYEGLGDIIRRQRAEGGLVCVVSHSFSEHIRRDYEHNFGLQPDEVYGWEYPPEKRKPSVFPVNDIMEKHGLSPSQLVMVDDLKPGYDMAKAAGIDFICAGWPGFSPIIEGYMRENCALYAETPAELERMLF